MSWWPFTSESAAPTKGVGDDRLNALNPPVGQPMATAPGPSASKSDERWTVASRLFRGKQQWAIHQLRRRAPEERESTAIDKASTPLAKQERELLQEILEKSTRGGNNESIGRARAWLSLNSLRRSNCLSEFDRRLALNPRMAHCFDMMSIGMKMGLVVGGIFGTVSGTYGAVRTRSFIVLPTSIVLGALSFGFFLTCGMIVRCEDTKPRDLQGKLNISSSIVFVEKGGKR